MQVWFAHFLYIECRDCGPMLVAKSRYPKAAKIECPECQTCRTTWEACGTDIVARPLPYWLVPNNPAGVPELQKYRDELKAKTATSAL